MPDDAFLTVAEVAARLRVNPETVRRWLRHGRLRGFLMGGDRAGYRIAESELQRFLHEELGASHSPGSEDERLAA
jgi:excisionase family DNA binding protein